MTASIDQVKALLNEIYQQQQSPSIRTSNQKLCVKHGLATNQITVWVLRGFPQRIQQQLGPKLWLANELLHSRVNPSTLPKTYECVWEDSNPT